MSHESDVGYLALLFRMAAEEFQERVAEEILSERSLALAMQFGRQKIAAGRGGRQGEHKAFSCKMLNELRGREEEIRDIDNWRREQSIDGLDWLDHGSNAFVLKAAQRAAGKQFVMRFGSFSPDRGDVEWHRPWCPLVVQPEIRRDFIYGEANTAGKMNLRVELLEPLLIANSWLQGCPVSFYDLLDQHVLRGTPYKVKSNRDWGIMRDGTPLQVDPGSLNYQNDQEAEKYAALQFSPAFQQDTMAVIHENCERAGLPEPLRWVVQKPDGSFITKQQLLYAPVSAQVG